MANDVENEACPPAFTAVDISKINQSKLQLPWINPLSIIALRDAVKHQRDEVTLNNRRYSIEYHGDKIWVQVLDATVPCGWFTIDNVLRAGGIMNDV